MSESDHEGEKRLALHHIDRYAPDIAFGADLDGLLVAACSKRQARREARSLDHHVDPAAAGRALQAAEDVAARFVPLAGDPVALALDVTREVELVAVAGAAKRLLQTKARTIHLVFRPAAKALARSVGKRYGSVAGPCSVEAGKGTRLRMSD